MARAAAKKKQPAKSLEQRLWDAADALRGNQEPSEYKHVVLGLVFLKYISDRFTARRAELEAELVADGIPAGRLADFLEARDEYTSHNVFWVPADGDKCPATASVSSNSRCRCHSPCINAGSQIPHPQARHLFSSRLGEGG